MLVKDLFSLACDLFSGGWLAARQRWIQIQLRQYTRAAQELRLIQRSKAYQTYANRREKRFNRMFVTSLVGCTLMWLCFLPVMFRLMQQTPPARYAPGEKSFYEQPVLPPTIRPKQHKIGQWESQSLQDELQTFIKRY